MKTIDLHKYYPWYPSGSILELADEIADALDEFEREMAAYKLRMYRNKAHYSLEYGNNIELLAISRPPTPDEIIESRHDTELLYAAIVNLPKKQAKRIYAYYFLNISKVLIAQMEGVSAACVVKSINRGISRLSEYFVNSLLTNCEQG